MPLGSYVGVANHAFVSHACGAPERGMTQAALVGNVRVGTNPAQRSTGLRVESAGTEQHTTGCKSEPCYDEGGQGCRHDSGNGKKTQTGILHHRPILAEWHNTTPHRYG